MKSPAATLVAAVASFLWTHASADSGEAVYKNRCSLCHAGGAGGAPKFGNREDWAPRAARGKLALYDVALHGKPNTAMMPRGGFRDLSNDEVMAAADYMLARAGFHPGDVPEAPAAGPAAVVAPPPVGPAVEADDGVITAWIADALCQLAPPGAKVEMSEETASVGGLGIKVTTRKGVVSLTGMVKNAEIIERAEAIAKSAAGVKTVESKLIAASIFEWD
jgi:cytochrome c5